MPIFPKPNLHIFGWPAYISGADTKLAHLIFLLSKTFEITVIPNDSKWLKDAHWVKKFRQAGIHISLLNQLPSKLNGVGLALSNHCFFTHQIAHQAKAKGLRIIWSSEMMWHHPGELQAVADGVIDKVLYVSEFQKKTLEINYGGLPSAITGNYIDPALFPWHERPVRAFTIGRLSRAAWEKYPENFPAFYEAIGPDACRYLVMAWSPELRKKYQWHNFDHRWDLLNPLQETPVKFLNSLDVFVYPLGHHFRESWGRSTVEAMLTGCVPVVPKGHHFPNLIHHGESGFMCDDVEEYREVVKKLFYDLPFRRKLAAQCRRHAVDHLCNAEEHLKIWTDALLN